MKELLEKLKSLDPTTYKRFTETELAEYEYDDENGSMVGYIYQEDLIDSAKFAWLQACLQEAISGKGWNWQVQIWNTSNLAFYQAYVVGGGAEREAQAESPAKALLAAYIATREVMT